jgi:hypothetical protein
MILPFNEKNEIKDVKSIWQIQISPQITKIWDYDNSFCTYEIRPQITKKEESIRQRWFTVQRKYAMQWLLAIFLLKIIIAIKSKLIYPIII